MNRKLKLGATASLAALMLLPLPAVASDLASGVEIHRTAYGVPHIKADTLAGAAFGMGYAYASDNVCLLADHILTVRAERSKFLGPDGKAMVVYDYVDNVSSDLFHSYYYQDDRLSRDFAGLSAESREMLEGYRQGYNHYLTNHPDSLPAPCRGASWVRPMTEQDLQRLVADKAAMASAAPLLSAILAAAPPGSAAPVAASLEDKSERFLGSNGWAFSGKVTDTGRGLVMANPHYPWEGPNRFYQVHLTVPGKLDVMGATLAPFPAVLIGFNKDVAWTHTVSTANRFTLFELAIDPKDVFSYVYDGKSRPITKRTVTIEVKNPDGTLTPRSHDFYETHVGPLVAHPAAGLGWTDGRAYALGDGNRGNIDMLDTWLAIDRAGSVEAVEGALKAKRGIPWVNTLAADRQGGALYADIGRLPNVTSERYAACLPSPGAAALLAAAKIMVLDGARSACDWTSGDTRWLAASAQATTTHARYVANSNDSYWLPNADGPVPALSPIMGPTAIPQRLRTRIGLIEIEDRLKAGKMSDQAAIDILFANDNQAGRMVADAVIAVCLAEPSVILADGATVDLTAACKALQAWDRKAELDSIGAPLFREFWMRMVKTPGLWGAAFDPADPVNTPRELAVDKPEVRLAVRQALGEAVAKLARNGYAPDVTLGEVQVAIRNGERIGISGGENDEGVLNLQTLRPLTPEGYTPYDGASYIQVVGFDAEGPRAVGVLAYSQSTDPASPHYADQTRLYSAETLYPLLFDWRAILADPQHRIQPISPVRKSAR